MAHRHSFSIVSGAAALLLLVSSAGHSASTRLPWAATSGLHFVEAVINADNYRAKAGGLAMKKSPSPDVRDFGRALWVEFDRRHTQLAVGAVPTTISPPYLFVIDELLPVTGDEFDRQFIAQQTASLTQALALAQAYARFGDDFDLKEYAARSAPKIKERLDQVLAIETQRGR